MYLSFCCLFTYLVLHLISNDLALRPLLSLPIFSRQHFPSIRSKLILNIFVSRLLIQNLLRLVSFHSFIFIFRSYFCHMCVILLWPYFASFSSQLCVLFLIFWPSDLLAYSLLSFLLSILNLVIKFLSFISFFFNKMKSSFRRLKQLSIHYFIHFPLKRHIFFF